MAVMTMAKEWTRFSSPSSYAGGNENTDFDFFKSPYIDDMLNSPLGNNMFYYPYRPDLKQENGIPFKGIVQQVTSDNDESSKKRQVLCPIGTLTSGDYIKYKDNYWIVVGLVDDNKFYEKAVMYYCNWSLKFIINPETDYTVLEYPVYSTNATQYNSGVKEANKTVVGTAQYMIYIQSNDETNKVERDTRILMDKNKEHPTAYKITQTDDTTKNFNDKGVNTWTLVECQTEYINDDIENGIANKVETDVLRDKYKNPNISQQNKKLLDDWA